MTNDLEQRHEKHIVELLNLNKEILELSSRILYEWKISNFIWASLCSLIILFWLLTTIN